MSVRAFIFVMVKYGHQSAKCMGYPEDAQFEQEANDKAKAIKKLIGKEGWTKMVPAALARCFNRVTRRNALRLMAAMACMAAMSCGYGDWPARYDEFFKLPVSDRRKAILEYSPSDQLELHVHATCDLHPAYLHLVEPIVDQRGASIINTLHRAAGQVPSNPKTARCRAYALTLLVEEIDRKGLAVDPVTRAQLAGVSAMLAGQRSNP